MNLLEIWNGAVELIAELASTTKYSNDEKLDRLTQRVKRVGESADDLTAMLPGYFGQVAKLAVDNPLTDLQEEAWLWKPFAELLYQVWKIEQHLLGAQVDGAGA